MDGDKSMNARLRTLESGQTHTLITLDNFKANLLFLLSDQKRFKHILSDPDKLTWKPIEEDANRGFENDGSEIRAEDRQTAAQKKIVLDYMLGVVAGYIEVLSRNFIVNQARSLTEIWSRLRVYYGCKKTGGQVLEIINFSLKLNETCESLWERMYAFTEDSLFDPADNITHPTNSTVKESLSPTTLNILVAEWLRATNPNLPSLVRHKFATQLRDHSLLHIREDISIVMKDLLMELDSARIQRYGRPSTSTPNRPALTTTKSCCLCKAANRKATGHNLCGCPFLPQTDKNYIQYLRGRPAATTRLVETEEDGIPSMMYCPIADTTYEECEQSPDIQRVSLETSPVLHATFNGSNINLTLDTGAEANLIRLDETKRLGIKVYPSCQRASQADGCTPLTIHGECHFLISKGHHKLSFSGLVVSNLGCPLLAGVPFHTHNDIYVRLTQKIIYLGQCCQINYDTDSNHSNLCAQPMSPALTKLVNRDLPCELPHVPDSSDTNSHIRSITILRTTCQTTLFPGEDLTFTLPSDFRMEKVVAIEPRLQARSLSTTSRPWLSPSITDVREGMIQLRNSSNEPIQLSRNEQLCNVRRTEEFDEQPSSHVPVHRTAISNVKTTLPIGTHYSDAVSLDPSNQLSPELRDKFTALHKEYDDAFNTNIGLYNGASGPFEAVINMGSTKPPQRKGRCPQYSHSNKVVLQDKFDLLEDNGVLATPESVGISVENVNPSFLVNKSNGGHRFVTSFGEVAQYVKPQPSLLPNVDGTLRSIGQWKKIIKSDLSSAYYQIPLARRSMKYCGVCSPFKGTRVYTRCAMGLPGSETALEELMCRILGDLIAEGRAAKIADDLYIGGNTDEEVFATWREVLQRFITNGIHLSASKTVICPASTIILGWVWNNGMISASPHRISALECCKPPNTVFGLRSFNGAFKFLGKVLPAYSDILSPLEACVAGRESKERIVWSDELLAHFEAAKRHVTTAKSIMLPRSGDELRIVTDAAVTKGGLAATLYVIRNKRSHLAGFFNAKMSPCQSRWLPCEAEALCIGSAVKMFSPYIIQSKHRTVVLTDSRPCVQAYEKLCRGEFSTSARVMTFLSILSDYGVKLGHIRGVENAVADYTSRNPIECTSQSCQVCKFVIQAEQSVVRAVQFDDVTTTTSVELFSNRAAWIEIQKSDAVLKTVHSHLSRGTRPLQKARNVGEVRRYLKLCRISQDGLLVVPPKVSMHAVKDRIVIPRSICHGIVTAFHLKLLHPSKNQLTKVMERQFYALNISDVIERVHSHCDVCSALQKIPAHFKEQTTSEPSEIGLEFSADVMRRFGQFILVIREKISAFTHACLVPNETGESLRDGILLLVSLYRSSCGQSVSVRVDPAPGFRTLVDDPVLSQYGIRLILGDEKNINKNPIAERCISEVHAQLTRLQPAGGKISEKTLAVTISNVNSQLRNCGLSAREIWTQRDQYNGKQLPISDREVIIQRHQQRLAAHKPSAKYKARGRTLPVYPSVQIGDLVYLMQDRDKTKIRERYIVTKVEVPNCTVQKFVGKQLRSRSYCVNLADCILVEASVIRESRDDDVTAPILDYTLTTGVSDDDSSNDDTDTVDNINIGDNAPADDNNDNVNNVDNGDNINAPANIGVDDGANVVIGVGRPRRALRRPVKLYDYVSDISDSDLE